MSLLFMVFTHLSCTIGAVAFAVLMGVNVRNKNVVSSVVVVRVRMALFFMFDLFQCFYWSLLL